MSNIQQRLVRRITIAGMLMGIGLLGGCRGANNTATTPADDVWATVDGRQILREDVNKAYRTVVPSSAEPPSVEEVLTLKLGILDELITQDVLLARARELGIEATDAEVENAYAEQKRAMSDEEFLAQLTSRGLTPDDVRRGLRRELSVRKLIDREITEKIAITDEDIATFYNQNRDQFNLPEPHYRLARIVVTPERDPQVQNRLNDDAATPDEARRKAEMLTERLRSGTNFAALAMDYSEDPQTAAQGGDMGLVPESALNELPAALRNAVLKTEPGRASTLTIGQNYVLLMVVSREPAGQRELGSAPVRDGIRDLLRARKEQLLNQAYITSMRGAADVTNHLARRVFETQGRIPGEEPASALPAVSESSPNTP